MTNQNQLYIETYYRNITLKNGKQLKFWKHYYPEIRYNKIKDDNGRITINSWEEFIRKTQHVEYTNKKGIKYCYVQCYDKDVWYKTKLYENKFEKMEIYYEYRILKQTNLTMKNLIERLNLEEFIQFLKDNEINYLIPKE